MNNRKGIAVLLCVMVICTALLSACNGQANDEYGQPPRSAVVPVLMYHHLDAIATNNYTVTPETFAMHMQTLYENGFNTITLRQLVDFVNYGTPLPPNPVVITFDDGYLSVYKYAFPILKQYGMVATSFVIGEAVGTDTYKNTGHPTIPKFCYEQAARMAGIMFIQSHTYDMHQWPPFELGRARSNILRWYDECEIEYEAILRADHARIANDIYYHLGEGVFAIAFPHGIYDELSLEILVSMGVRVTFTTNHGTNFVRVGMPQTLLSMNRMNIADYVTAEDLLELLATPPDYVVFTFGSD